MPKTKLKVKPWVAFAPVLALVLFIGASHAMSILGIKLPLTGAWKERFQDVEKLNAYAKTNPVEISGHKIEKYNIDGANLHGGRFENTDWKDVSVKKAHLTKMVFRHGIIEDVDFSHSILTDVVFEDVKLRGVAFFYGSLKNVRFVRCTFNGVGIEQTKDSTIEVVDSKAISSSFSDGQLTAVFRNTKLSDEVRISDLQPPSSLTFEKSELDDVNMERSKLKALVIEESKVSTSVLKVGSTDSISIRNSTLEMSFSGSTIGRLSVDSSVIQALVFNRAKVGSILLTNCSRGRNIGTYQAIVDTLDIKRCPLDEFELPETVIELLRINDSSITNSKFEGMKAKSWILENVTLDGTLDFTGAQVGELKATNVTKQPGLKLITEGSNVRF